LYIGRVEYFEHRDDKPLLFYAGKYEQLPTEANRISALSNTAQE